MTDCVFCQIVSGDAPSEIVAQNERALAVMDINPATDGHTLVISKAHAADIWELRPEDGEAVWSLTSDVAGAIRDSLHPEGLTLFQANRKAVGKTSSISTFTWFRDGRTTIWLSRGNRARPDETGSAKPPRRSVRSWVPVRDRPGGPPRSGAATRTSTAIATRSISPRS